MKDGAIPHEATARPFDAAAFAPYGAFVHGPDTCGARTYYSNWLTPVAGLGLQFHVNNVRASGMPLVLDHVERHPHAAQVFLPLDVERYLVAVMPDAADGTPDLARALCMEVPGTLGVIYAAGTWHAGAVVLGQDGHFAVLMHRGASDDDIFAPIAPLRIQPWSHPSA